MNVLSIDVDWIISNLHQQSLTKLFYNKVGKAKSIAFGNHHHQILNVLTTEKTNTKINLFNIDHHHDICYNQYQYELITKQYLADSGSWVGLLLSTDNISSLKWIRNVESIPIFMEQYAENLLTYHNNVSSINFSVDYILDSLYNEDYDLIFVCRSDEHTDIKYRSLYDTLKISCIELYPEKTYEVSVSPDITSTLLGI